jgi:hypothetical protein
MPLNPEDTKVATYHMNEALGGIVGVTLLTCDDLTTTKENIIRSVAEFSEDMRTMLTAAQRTDVAKQNVKEARYHLREMTRVLNKIEETKGPDGYRDRS